MSDPRDAEERVKRVLMDADRARRVAVGHEAGSASPPGVSARVEVQPAEPDDDMDWVWVEALNLATVLCSGHGPSTILAVGPRKEFLEVARWYYTNLQIPPGEGDPA